MRGGAFRWMLLVSVVVALPATAFAQEGSIASPPAFVPGTGIYTTKSKTENEPSGVYSTKPQAAPFGRAPQSKQAAAESRQVPVGNIPFGRASQEVTAPVPTGPRNVTAAPVEEVGIVAEELAPAKEAEKVALSPKDPTEPTPLTTPIFEAEDENTVPLRHVVLRALNKVTGHTTEMEGLTGTVMRFGNLEIIAKSCRKSAPTSQLDYASLLTISELKPDEAPKELFSGWMYASSPSLVALEHPVYDVTVEKCAADKSKPKAAAS